MRLTSNLDTDDLSIGAGGALQLRRGPDDDEGGLVHVDDKLRISAGAGIDGAGSISVEFADLLLVLAAWGDSGGPEDVDGSGTVDFGDVLAVLANWGVCK